MQAGLVQHNCESIGRTILIHVTMERYNSRMIAQAKCLVCNKDEFAEKSVDKSVAPSKGFYMTV